MQKSVRYNEGHALYLAFLARKEGTKRGFLSKKAAEASRWHEKWFALYQNVLFYFEGEQSGRPAGMYLLEGCSCERTPAPPRAGVGPAGARDALDKQVPSALLPLSPSLPPWNSLFQPSRSRARQNAGTVLRDPRFPCGVGGRTSTRASPSPSPFLPHLLVIGTEAPLCFFRDPERGRLFSLRTIRCFARPCSEGFSVVTWVDTCWI